MKNPKRSILFALITAGAALALDTPAAMAQHDHGTKQPGGVHGAGEKHESPTTYAEAIAEIDGRLENIGGLIKSKKLDDVHKEAEVVVNVANTLAALALRAGSGVPKEAVKEINKTAKELAGKFDAIDKAGDSGDEPGVQKALGEMIALQATLRKYAPAGGGERGAAHDVYFCPMHCEGTKTYDKPGSCPICNMHLKKQTSDKFTVDIKPVGAPGGRIEAGKAVNFLFTLRDPTGQPVRSVEIVHEKPLHLLMVSKDLSWYAHEHPVLQPNGTFTFTYTFPEAGEFFFYNDFTPPNVGQQVVTVPITVAGTAPSAKALRIDTGAPKIVDGYTVTLDTGGPVKTGGATHMAYTISKDGKPVTTLAPYLGAMGHLVIISEDRKQFVHSHPHESGAGHEGDGMGGMGGMGGPKVDFEAHFTVPGTYKGWAQFNVGTAAKERVITVPFTFSVAKGDGSGEAKPHDHGHGK